MRYEVHGVPSKYSVQTVMYMIKGLVLPGLNLPVGKFAREGIDIK